MSFPQQLITELSDNLNPVIIDFIDKNEFGFSTSEFNTKYVVCDCLEQFFSSEPDAIRKKMISKRKEIKRKKNAWIDKLDSESEKYEFDHPKNPFYSIYIVYNNMPARELKQLHWDCSFSEVIQLKKDEIEKWRNDNDAFLIQFPYLRIYSNLKIKAALYLDVFTDLYRYINDVYKLDITDYQKLYPDTFVRHPLFSEIKEDLEFEPSDENSELLVNKLMLTKDSVFNTIIAIDNMPSKQQMKTLGPKDLEMIQYGMFNNIKDAFYSTRTVTTKLRVFAQILCPVKGKYNKQYVTKAGDVVLSYQKFRYAVRDLKRNIAGDAFTLFDRITILNPDDFEATDDNPYSPDADVIIHFGDRLYNDILQAQIVGITQASYEKVNSELAHQLAPMLQMQRTILTKDFISSHGTQNYTDEAMSKSYDYAYFTGSVRLPTRRKRENIQRLKCALQEYVDANLFVKHFTLKDNVYYICFYPLSEDELADIQIHKASSYDPKQITMIDILESQSGE